MNHNKAEAQTLRTSGTNKGTIPEASTDVIAPGIPRSNTNNCFDAERLEIFVNWEIDNDKFCIANIKNRYERVANEYEIWCGSNSYVLEFDMKVKIVVIKEEIKAHQNVMVFPLSEFLTLFWTNA